MIEMFPQIMPMVGPVENPHEIEARLLALGKKPVNEAKNSDRPEDITGTVDTFIANAMQKSADALDIDSADKFEAHEDIMG